MEKSESTLEQLRTKDRQFSRIVVVLPAYNAATTLKSTVEDIPEGTVDEIILVDDRSEDDTVAIARSLGLTVIEHEKNRGYGGNQKTCYAAALETGADLVIMLHPDYQYDARLIPYFVGFLKTGVCDIMLGNRVRTRREALSSGMPSWKYLANRLLTLTENFFLGQNLGDFHSGFRMYTRQVLETIPYERNSEDFVFDSQFLIQAAHFGFRIGDAPIPSRYFAEASSIGLTSSIKYGCQTLLAILRLYLHRARLARSPLFESK